jgi:hypothetical protein
MPAVLQTAVILPLVKRDHRHSGRFPYLYHLSPCGSGGRMRGWSGGECEVALFVPRGVLKDDPAQLANAARVDTCGVRFPRW